MRDSPTLRSLHKTTHTYSPSPQRASEIELSTMPQDRRALTPRLPEGLGEEGETRGTTRSGEVERLRREVGVLIEECERRGGVIAELEHEIVKVRSSWQKDTEAQAQQARTMEKRLKQTEGLLKARSTELCRAQTFLSTADRLSEMEVLDIVRDLNENIYQATVSLTEEWEKLGPSQTTGRLYINHGSRTQVPVLVRLARNRDLTGLTLLLQSHLCSQAVNITSSWGRRQELKIIREIYQRLSTSGEHHAIDTKWYVAYAP